MGNKKGYYLTGLLIGSGLLLFSACQSFRLNRQLTSVSEFSESGMLNEKSPFLKAHMRDGKVYVLTQWAVGDKARLVSGQGEVLDVNRRVLQKGAIEIPFDDVVLFETNAISQSPAITGMTLMTGVSLAGTIYCIINPKACFGSCPTFYAWDGERMALQAEGFSASVAPSLESRDIDALPLARPSSDRMEIQVTNEAYETHVIRYANLLAVPRPERGRVFVTPGGDFWQTAELREPESCAGPEGNFLDKVRSLDGLERFSPADGENLAARETIEIVFPRAPDEPLGLVLAFRQTLLTTYLFYQGLAYLGDRAGSVIAQMERDGTTERIFKDVYYDTLGGIDVFLGKEGGQWIRAGTLSETGPIASNVQLVPLPGAGGAKTRLRLRMTKGLWRLDQVALVKLERKIGPVRIEPALILHQRISEFSAGTDRPAGVSGWPLVTLPGDAYSLTYELPSDFAGYEYFIETQGYYLEWLRSVWMAEKNPRKARSMILNPGGFLRQLAPEFKKVESRMEEIFWESRYAKTDNR